MNGGTNEGPEQQRTDSNSHAAEILSYYLCIIQDKGVSNDQEKKDRELIKSLNRLDEAYHHGWELWGPYSQFLVLHTVTDILWNLFSWAFVMKSIAMCCRIPSVHALDSG